MRGRASAESMVMRADQALYAAKAQGRDRFHQDHPQETAFVRKLITLPRVRQ